MTLTEQAVYCVTCDDSRAVRSPPSHLAAMQRTLGLLALFMGTAAAIRPPYKVTK
jgi:hypothetical protein